MLDLTTVDTDGHRLKTRNEPQIAQMGADLEKKGTPLCPLRSFAAINLLFAKRSCSGEAGSSVALLEKTLRYFASFRLHGLRRDNWREAIPLWLIPLPVNSVINTLAPKIK